MITLANLKKYLKITDDTQNDQLNLAIDNAIWFLTAYLWYSLELDAAKVAIFHWYDNQFELKHTNINAVSDIKYTDDEFNPTWTDYNDATNQSIYLNRGVVKTRDSIWPITKITYSFWYEADGAEAVYPTPKDLAAILYDVAAMNFKSMGEVSMWDLKSETVDGDQLVFKDIVWQLSPNAIALLDKYKIYDFSA